MNIVNKRLFLIVILLSWILGNTYAEIYINELHSSLHSSYNNVLRDLKNKPNNNDLELEKRIYEYYGLIMNANAEKAYSYIHPQVIRDEKNGKTKYAEYIKKKLSNIHEEKNQFYLTGICFRSIEPLHRNEKEYQDNPIAHFVIITFSYNHPSFGSKTFYSIWEKFNNQWYIVPIESTDDFMHMVPIKYEILNYEKLHKKQPSNDQTK